MSPFSSCSYQAFYTCLSNISLFSVLVHLCFQVYWFIFQGPSSANAFSLPFSSDTKWQGNLSLQPVPLNACSDTLDAYNHIFSVIFWSKSLIWTNLLEKSGFKFSFFLHGFPGLHHKRYISLCNFAFSHKWKLMCKAEWTETLLCCISDMQRCYGRELVRNGGYFKRKISVPTALHLKQSNADIRHKNIFHCESGALAKSGKNWILSLFMFENEKCTVIRTWHKNRCVLFNLSALASFTALQNSECVFSDLLTKFPAQMSYNSRTWYSRWLKFCNFVAYECTICSS